MLSMIYLDQDLSLYHQQMRERPVINIIIIKPIFFFFKLYSTVNDIGHLIASTTWYKV